MKQHNRQRSWARLFLWSHVVGVMAFYIILWLRTRQGEENREPAIEAESTSSATTITSGQRVSIIVPARDEEATIRRCVTSLLEQDYEDYEVIVVDDGSTDRTAAILDDIAHTHPQGGRLWVLRLRDLPPGWAGKPHALHRGIQEAQGDWLLFSDADTWHAPGALRWAVSQAVQDGADLFSLATQQELPGFWNKVMMPMAYIGITMQYPPRKVNDAGSSVALANGQYMLIRREVYDTLGGYARPDLRGTLLDDRDLARIVKDNGYRLRLVDGRHLVHVRMYQGLRETWQGWRKNAFLGSRGGLPAVLLMLIGLPLVSIAPFLLPLLGWLNRGKRVRGISALEAGIATPLELAPLLVYRLWVNKELGIPWYYIFTHPLAGGLFEGILAQSTWRVLTGQGVDWRGRQYYTGQDLPPIEPRQAIDPAATQR
ncbi:MAG: glycosyltransferase family 2 protein [Chloroflexota bacterium]|nr:glycosyltransferase family 2 protein [Chloroflexota bacterium]